jgi:hypothetical protein
MYGRIARSNSPRVRNVPPNHATSRRCSRYGIVVRRAAEHRAVDVRQVRRRFVFRRDAAVDDHLQSGPIALERIRPVVTQRRDFAVFLRRQALEPGIARMHDEHAAARGGHGVDEGEEVIEVVVVVDAQAALHRDRDSRRRRPSRRRCRRRAPVRASGTRRSDRPARDRTDNRN